MKKLLLFFLLVCGVACDSDQAPDCLRTTGKMITKTLDLPPFDQVMTYNGIKLYITDGPQQKVMVKTGENLMNNIELSVKNHRLLIKNHNTCNWVRGYRKTSVYITAPDLNQIKNGSAFKISSTDTLHYDTLTLISEDWQDEGHYHTDGNFDLILDCKHLRIINNFLSSYHLSGRAQNFKIGIYAGDGRIEAKDLQVQRASIYHRGTNDIILNALQSVTGELLSTGNLILVHHPDTVAVSEKYKGKVIYR